MNSKSRWCCHLYRNFILLRGFGRNCNECVVSNIKSRVQRKYCDSSMDDYYLLISSCYRHSLIWIFEALLQK